MSTLKTTKVGKTTRLDFTKKPDKFILPDFLAMQKNSYNDFLNIGIKEMFQNYFPVISPDETYEVDVMSYEICTDEIKYGIEECKKRGISYEAPIKVNVRLMDKVTNDIIEEVVSIGNLPIMTDRGTFIINGSEKVVVNQIVRSPGCYYKSTYNKKGQIECSGQIIPARGAWLEFEESNGILSVKIDKKKKIKITTLLRILGVENNYQFIEKFGDNEVISKTLEKDNTEDVDSAYKSIYAVLKPDQPSSKDAAITYITKLLFDKNKYTLEKSGRYKINRKLALKERITGTYLAKDIINPIDKKTLYYTGEYITKEIAEKIQDTGCDVVTVSKDNQIIKVISNRMVNIAAFGKEYEDLGLTEKVYYPEVIKLIGKNVQETKEAIRENLNKIIPVNLTNDDLLAAISYICTLHNDLGETDNIDHLKNRRVRCVGELVGGYFGSGLNELRNNIKDILARSNNDEITSRKLFNPKSINGNLKGFFNVDDRVQNVSQDNILSELSHKNRITASGTGGVNKERAGFEIRDINNSHYGKMCPVETPEGESIGLVTNFTTCAKLDKYGFIQAPYKVIDKTDSDNPVVTDEIVYLDAEDEAKYIIAQASEELDSQNHFVNDNILCHCGEIIAEYPKSKVDYIDATPKMMFSITANMIPFLQNDDANRALMGSNMMKQAVPLLFNDSAKVSTGIEEKIARDSRECIIAEEDGIVTDIDSNTIIIEEKNGQKREYDLYKLRKGSSNSVMRQMVNVSIGDEIKKDEIIADGPSVKNGELALGQNPLIGFMEWEGYNYEDAVLISERIVKDDVYTSLHVFDYACEVREIDKCGLEEITPNMVGLPANELKNLDIDGIVKIGTHVKEGDILVGKTTPKNPDVNNATDVETKLKNLVLGINQRKVKNTPLKVPHGMYGTVIGYDRYTKDKGDILPSGVYEKVVVRIAQLRKIQVGDKMAGRHGNKGVVSRVLPVEDMPYLSTGQPLDIVLNPLGVPSRMNIGQVLELHLGLISEILGIKSLSPIFNGVTENEMRELKDIANDYLELSEKKFKTKYKDKLSDEVFANLDSSNKAKWEGFHIYDGYKATVYDGRTGEQFPQPISVGYMHYLRLHHMVEDKIHARSTGSYSVVDQQPPEGRANNGGQRLGEMETWAIIAHGATNVYQEMMTIKSDDVAGRSQAYKAIIEGNKLPIPKVPESFRVLLKKLQGVGLDVSLYNGQNEKIKMDAELINLAENKFIDDQYGFYQEDDSDKSDNKHKGNLSENYQMGLADAYNMEDIDSLFDGKEED